MKFKFMKMSYLKLFIISGIILTSIFLIGYIFNPSLFYIFFHDIRTDFFMDFFNSVSHSMGRDPYGIEAIYPPLCYVLYWILGMLMGSEALDVMERLGTGALRGHSQAMMVFGIYFMVSFTIFIYLAYRLIQGVKYEKVCFLVLITLAIPFMYQFERANIIFIALLGTMAFFVWKDSKNKYLREFALICLALSAAIKIYPAILGLVLVKEKRYKESVRLMIYGVVCFFLPFLFIRGGFSNIPQFIKNLIYTSTDFSADFAGYKLNFSATCTFIIEKLTNNVLIAKQIGGEISVGITVLSVCALPWLKKSWKTILLLMCLLVGVPPMNYIYTAIFFIVPLIFFLNDTDNETFKGVYFILFILIFFPLPLGWSGHPEIEFYYRYNRSFYTNQSAFAILAMTVLLIKEGLWNFIHLKAKNVLKRGSIVFGGFLVIIAVLSIGVKLNYAQAISDKKEQEAVVEKTLKKANIVFNGKEYRGVYDGQTVNNKPFGDGVFTFSEADGGLKLFGKWKQNSLNGSIKVVYPDGTYETAFCESGQMYGKAITYSENGVAMGSEWYYQLQKLSHIKRSATEEDFKDIKFFKPGTIKFQGEVIRVNQIDTYIEVTVNSSSGQKYLVSYYNGELELKNQTKAPNLGVGDQVLCYGTLNGKNRKGILGIDLVVAELADMQGMDLEKLDSSYEDIMRYPYKYLGESAKLQGEVKEIIRDFDKNSLTYIIEHNKDSYAFVIDLEKLFESPYIMPNEDKKPIVRELEKLLPSVGDTTDLTGVYKGNYIWEKVKGKEYTLKPCIYTSAQMNPKGEYIFE